MLQKNRSKEIKNFAKQKRNKELNQNQEILDLKKNVKVNKIKLPKQNKVKKIDKRKLIENALPFTYDEQEQRFIDVDGKYIGMVRVYGTNIFGFSDEEKMSYLNSYLGCFTASIGEVQLYSYQISANIDQYQDTMEFVKYELNPIDEQDNLRHDILSHQQNIFEKAMNTMTLVDRCFVFVLKDRDIYNLNRRCQEIVTSLSLNSRSEILNSDDMKDIIYSYYNPYNSNIEPSKARKTVNNCSVMDYMYPDFIGFGGNSVKPYIEVNDTVCRILYVSSWSKTQLFAYMSQFTTAYDVDFCLHCTPTADKSDLIKDLDKSYKNIIKQIEHASDPSEVVQLSEQRERMQEMIKNVNTNLSMPIYFTVALRIKGKSLESVNQLKKKMIENASQFGIILREGFANPLEMFNLVAPICRNDVKYTDKLTLSDTIAYGYPLMFESLYDLNNEVDENGNLKVANPPVYLGNSLQSGGVVFYDNFTKVDDRVNYNEFIVGNSGMGKTTEIMHLIWNRFASGYKQFILDVEGKELPKMVNFLKGENINCSNGEEGMINPFQVRINVEDDAETTKKRDLSKIKPLSYHMQFLRGFFKSYQDGDDIKSLHMNYLEIAIEKVYKEKGIDYDTTANQLLNLSSEDYPIMLDIYNELNNMYLNAKQNKEDPTTVRRLEETKVFIKPLALGADSCIFNGYTNINLENNLICFNLSSLQSNSNSKVLRAQYYNVLSFIWNSIVSDKKTQRKQVYCDEFHVVMNKKFEDCMIFMKNMIKRVRKYKCGMTTATQEIADVLNPSVREYGEAFIENSCYQFFFGLGANGIKYFENTKWIPEQEKEFVAKAMMGQCYAKFGTSTAMRMKVNIDKATLSIFESFKQ